MKISRHLVNQRGNGGVFILVEIMKWFFICVAVVCGVISFFFGFAVVRTLQRHEQNKWAGFATGFMVSAIIYMLLPVLLRLKFEHDGYLLWLTLAVPFALTGGIGGVAAVSFRKKKIEG